MNYPNILQKSNNYLFMRKQILILVTIVSQICAVAQQKVIQLYNGTARGSESWSYNEKYDSVPAPFVYNVSHPTLTVYLPDPSIANGAAIILCPGGGFFILDMKNAS